MPKHDVFDPVFCFSDKKKLQSTTNPNIRALTQHTLRNITTLNCKCCRNEHDTTREDVCLLYI